MCLFVVQFDEIKILIPQRRSNHCDKNEIKREAFKFHLFFNTTLTLHEESQNQTWEDGWEDRW